MGILEGNFRDERMSRKERVGNSVKNSGNIRSDDASQSRGGKGPLVTLERADLMSLAGVG